MGGAYSYHRQNSGPNCYLSVHPMQTQDLIYRDYLFSDSGVFMVFNSYGEGPNSETTAARVFYIFPRNQMPDIEIKNESIIVKTAHSKSSFEFSKKSTEIINFSNGKVSQDPKVHPNNKGGVEISSQSVLILDVGFTVGKDPSEDPNRISTFSDGKNTCRVKNSTIFRYEEDGNVELKFTDSELKRFLSQTCPQLKINF